jgi:hypothetical protein
MRDLLEKSLLLEKKVKTLLEQGEKQASLKLTHEITEVVSATLSHFQMGRQKETEKRIESFINLRLGSIKNADTPIELKEGAKIVVHIIPLSAFEHGKNFDVSFLKEHSYMLPQLTNSSYDYRFNYDGYMTFYHSSSLSTYVQLLRNGCIEIVDNSVFSPNKKIFATKFESAIVEQVPKYLRLLNERWLDGPYLIQITFLEVKDYTIYIPNSFYYEIAKIDKSELHLPKVVIDNLDEHFAKPLKPAFDVLWNSGGYSGSINYNNGNWSPKN